MIIGVISDTHGLLRPEAVEALKGSQYIIHAGDVGDPAILRKLEGIAPVTVVRGNVDVEPWARMLPEADILEAGGRSIYVLHNLDHLDLKPEASGFAAVVYGHSHRPAQEIRNGVLFFNPGSAGPRRFSLPICLGRLVVEGGTIQADLVELGDQSFSKRRG